MQKSAVTSHQDYDSAYVSNVVELPESIDPFIVKRSCFTTKHFQTQKLIVI